MNNNNSDISKTSIFEQASTYYTAKLSQYGQTTMGVDWNSKAAQEIRFTQITKVITESPTEHFTICDYGCGLGDYDDYLHVRFQFYDYFGLDVSEKMVETAKTRHPARKFSATPEITGEYDYVVASGIFNVKQSVSDSEWLEYILKTLVHFNQHSKKGFSFNCLTKYSDEDHKKDYLYYADPLFLFDYCKTKFSRNVALFHDYQLYDFTIVVRKNLE